MDIKDVENLAELSRLELENEEKESMLHDLGGILGYVNLIKEADPGDIKIDHELHNVWREDTPGTPPFSKVLIVEQFPDSKDGFLKVKKIL